MFQKKILRPEFQINKPPSNDSLWSNLKLLIRDKKKNKNYWLFINEKEKVLNNAGDKILVYVWIKYIQKKLFKKK